MVAALRWFWKGFRVVIWEFFICMFVDVFYVVLEIVLTIMWAMRLLGVFMG